MCRVRNIKGALKFQDEMKTLGINSHNVVVSLIVRGLANSKKIDNAIWVLDLMLEMQIIPIVDTFTTLMHVYYKEAYVTKALELKSIMEDCHVKLGVVAYNVLISSLYTNGDIEASFKLYEKMKQKHVWPTTSIYIVLIDSFCCRKLSSLK